MSIISISLTEEEERRLKLYADALGVSIATYMKYVATVNTKMINALHEVINRILELRLGDSFRIKELIPETWEELDQSERRALGIALSNLVKDRKLSYLTVEKDTNGDRYSIIFAEQTVKFEMQESTKEEMRAILKKSGEYIGLKSYSPALSKFCDDIMAVVNKAIEEQVTFMNKKQDEALKLCDNTSISPEDLSNLNKTFLRVELDPEATYLIDKLIELQSKCIANLFSR